MTCTSCGGFCMGAQELRQLAIAATVAADHLDAHEASEREQASDGKPDGDGRQ